MDANEIEMIKAYIDKPKSEDFYIDAFEAYSEGGIDQFKWKWSWWAFAGGVFFLLYRKLYIEALIFFFVSAISSMVPVVSLVVWIVSGALFPYLVYLRYKKGKELALAKTSDRLEQLKILRTYGGYNQWAVYLGVVINIFVMLWLLYMITLFAGLPNAMDMQNMLQLNGGAI